MTGLEKFANDAGFQAKWRAVKLANKTTLANHLGSFEPSALLDAQCKRIHEYKRQHLNLLHAIALWQRIGNGEDIGAPRTFVSGGKAAPAYWMAKLIIRLAAGIGERLAADPVMRDQLRVLFVPDFSVKVAQRIYPAADLPEQISTAGLEASGTGNMKFTLNGALTIGTLDGANVEIRDAVGADHFFLFGLPAEQVIAEKRDGYHPGRYIHGELANALDLVASGAFSRGDKAMFEPLVTDLRNRDPFLVCADFEAYAAAQRAVVELWKSPKQWLASSLINVARSGRFSSDRSIAEYAKQIWNVAPLR